MLASLDLRVEFLNNLLEPLLTFPVIPFCLLIHLTPSNDILALALYLFRLSALPTPAFIHNFPRTTLALYG